MKKIIAVLLSVFLFAGVKVSSELKNTNVKIAKMNQKLDRLAKEIMNKEANIESLKKQELKIKKQIKELEEALKNSNQTLTTLSDLARSLNKRKGKLQQEIIKFISQNYYLNTKQADSLNDLIYSEINKRVLDVYAKKIQKYVDEYEHIDNNLRKTNQQISLIQLKKEILLHKKKQLAKLRKKQLKQLQALKQQKKEYKSKLVSMMRKQRNLRNKLQELKIVKKREEINVKKVGSAYMKPKVAYYHGRKTIPPVYGRVVKKFGSYIDPIYKIKIYNDSITIKTKPNSVVRSIMKGQVVYIGNNGDKKVVFIKHPGNLFSIYANLSKVSPLLKKGSYVKQGQIIARVKDSLEFEVTYKDRPINPLRVVKLR